MDQVQGQTAQAGGGPRLSWHMGRVLLAVLLAQCVYWLVVRPAVIQPPSLPESYERFNPRAARLDAPTPEALARARFAPVELPWWTCCRGYAAFAVDWKMERVPPGGVAIVPMVDADNQRVYVNGHLVLSRGSMTIPGVSHQRLRTVIFVSPGLVREGTNTVTYVMAREALPYFDVGAAPLIGDWEVYSRHYARRMFIFNDYATIGYTIGFVLAALAMAVMIRSERRAFPFWLSAVALTWSLLTHFYVWTEAPLGAHFRILYYFALTNFLPVAILNLADAWTERPLRWLTRASLALFAAIMAGTAWAYLALPQPEGFDLAGTLADWTGLGLAAAVVLRFGWHLWRHRDDRWLEVGIFTLLVSLVALDRYALLVGTSAGGNISQTAPLLLLALVAAYLARNVRLFASMRSYNAELQSRVAAREAELEVAHARERDLVRREAHEEERRRIMRDMHDGLGSQLMSLLLAARRNALPGERMAEGLQAVMDEMRLILDSMDSVGESLASALVMFRTRTAERVAAAGLAFDWEDSHAAPMPAMGPRDVLNVFRILQEAVNNALRHAGASRISLRIEDSPLPGHGLRLVIADDGKGIDPQVAEGAAAGGRGLANMRTRAAALGAEIAFAGTAGGTRITLDLAEQAA